MSKETIDKLYFGEYVKDKELLFIRDELDTMSTLLSGMGNAFKPFFLESNLRLLQTQQYLSARNVFYKSLNIENKFDICQNIKSFIKDKKTFFEKDELELMIEHLENIQLSASKLGNRYLLLDKYIFTLLEDIKKL